LNLDGDFEAKKAVSDPSLLYVVWSKYLGSVENVSGVCAACEHYARAWRLRPSVGLRFPGGGNSGVYGLRLGCGSCGCVAIHDGPCLTESYYQ